MATVAELQVKIGADLSEFNRKIGQVAGKAQAMGDKLTAVGKSMTASITAPILGIGAASVKIGADFESSLTTLKTQIGSSKEQVAAWKDEIVKLAPAVGVGPVALSDALFVVVSAGADAADAMGIVEQAAKASAVGLGDTKDIARALTASMTAYSDSGLTAERATNILMATVKAGNLEADQLAGSLGKVLPIASSMGVSFEEVGANVATFTRLGVTASEAITGLKGTLSAISKPTAQAEEQALALGISFSDMRKQIREGGLADVLTELIEKTEGNDTAMSNMFGSVESLASILGVAGAQGADYKDIVAGMKGELDLLNTGFEQVEETSSQKWAKIGASLQVAAVKISDVLAPAVEKALAKVQALIDKFLTLDGETQELIVTVAGLAAAMGPATIAMGLMVKQGGNLLSLVTKIGVLFSPLTLAVGAFAVAAVLVYKNWDKVQKFIKTNVMPRVSALSGVFDTVKSKISTAVGAIATFVFLVFNDIKEFWAKWGETTTATMSGLWDSVKDIFSSAFLLLEKITTFSFRTLATFWGYFGDEILTIVGNMWNIVATVFKQALDFVSGIFDFWRAVFSGDVRGALSAIAGIFTDTWDNVKHIVKIALQGILDFLPDWAKKLLNIPTMIEGVGSDIASEFDAANEGAENLKEGVEGAGEAVVTAASKVTLKIPDFTKLGESFGGITSTLGSASGGGSGGTTAAVEDFGEAVGNVATKFTGPEGAVNAAIAFAASLTDVGTAITEEKGPVSAIDQMALSIMGIASGSGGTVTSVQSDAEKIGEAFSNIEDPINTVKGLIEGNPGGIKGAFSSLKGLLGEGGPFGDLLGGLGLGGLQTSITGIVTSIPGIGVAAGIAFGAMKLLGIDVNEVFNDMLGKVGEAGKAVANFLTGGNKGRDQSRDFLNATMKRLAMENQTGGGIFDTIMSKFGNEFKSSEWSQDKLLELAQRYDDMFDGRNLIAEGGMKAGDVILGYDADGRAILGQPGTGVDEYGNRMTGGSNLSGGGTTDIHITVDMDGDKVAEAVVVKIPAIVGAAL
jgi:TP901 family phage tail tape measure protein